MWVITLSVNGRLRIGRDFLLFRKLHVFFFYVKSFVSGENFQQPECAAIENDNQTVGVAFTFTHERETEKKTRKCINHQLDEILPKIEKD